jgi:hypothetical protein
MIIFWETLKTGGATDYPVESDVRFGVIFNNGSSVGSLIVPSVVIPINGDKFDIEGLLAIFEARLKLQLAARITSVNDDKDDGFTIDQINDDAWVFLTLDERVNSYTDFVFYDIETVKTTGYGPALSREYRIEVVLFIMDRKDNNIEKRVLRYWRALDEAVRDLWNKIDPGLQMEFESLTPIDVKLVNSSHRHKAIGVSTTITFNN